MMDKKIHVEEQLSTLLTEGDMSQKEPTKEAPKRLATRYEVRIQAEQDPIVEETKQFREIAKEVDNRYDRFMPRKDQ